MDLLTIFGLVILIFSIIVHEVAHGYAAHWLGDPTARLQGRLTLNPLPHIDPIGSILLPGILMLSHAPIMIGWAKPVPFNPYNLRNQRWGEAIVAGAGPLTNILIAVIFALIIRFGGGADMLSSNFIQLAGLVVYINLLLALFNLIPIPPLDGSKVLKSVLPFRAAMSFSRLEAWGGQSGLLLFGVLIALMYVVWPFFHAILSFVFLVLTGMRV